MRRERLSSVALAVIVWTVQPSAQRATSTPPDLQGLWTNGTATPFQRPKEFADKPVLTESEAAEYERTGIARRSQLFDGELAARHARAGKGRRRAQEVIAAAAQSQAAEIA
jgi:hypothetical protein